MSITTKDILVVDIETLCELFIWMGYEPFSGSWRVFEISRRKNDLYALIKYLEENKDKWFVGFNNVRFDAQVVEKVIRKFKKWFDLSNEEIVQKIYQISQDIIDDINHELFPPYREEDLSNKQIDLFKIHGYENKNRRTSLKWIEMMVDVDEIETMPIPHWKKDMTDDEIEKTIHYCRNDIITTYKFYQYTRGDTSHSFYQGKDKIQDRLDIIEDMGFTPETINFSDVKIGDEINKRGYMALTGYDFKKIYSLKKNRKSTAGFTFGQCIPKYVKFQTSEFDQFYNSIKDIRINLGKEKQEFPFIYNKTKYVIARGGLHSGESNRIIEPGEDEILMDADVGSQYPNALRKRELYPSHLGKKWLINYNKTIVDRIEFKRLGKTDRKYKSKAEGLKLALNGGGYGKTGEPTNWQYDPFVMYRCTIGNQFEILMLIEMLETAGIHVVSGNTDGLTSLFPKNLLPIYYQICHDWENLVGNTELGQLEFVEYKKWIQESINHYIVVKADGSTKIKGRFDVDVELNKNNTDKIGRIERLAIQEYFVKGTPIETTIIGCDDIFKFCIGMKAGKDYHYISVETKSPYKQETYDRVVRFFVSKEGVRLHKMKNPNSEAPGANKTDICGENKVTIFNKSFFPPSFKDYNINYPFYIDRAQEIVDKIERGGKRKGKKVPKEQLSLF